MTQITTKITRTEKNDDSDGGRTSNFIILSLKVMLKPMPVNEKPAGVPHLTC